MSVPVPDSLGYAKFKLLQIWLVNIQRGFIVTVTNRNWENLGNGVKY